MSLNKLSKEIHQANKDKGFYDDKRETGTLLMLCVSELSEALEADRKGRYAGKDQAKLASSVASELGSGTGNEYFKEAIKDTFEDEIADTMIRLLDLCGYMEIDIEEHIRLKLEYNASRPHKHGKKY